MPTYVYKDLETGELYEFKQSMSEEAYRHHPKTGAPIKRLISPPAIAFKGSGFYVNDSRSAGKGASSAAKKSEGAATPASASSGGKSSGDS